MSKKFSMIGADYVQIATSNHKEKLPAEVFTLNFNPDYPGGFYLTPRKTFTIPDKIYGDVGDFSDIIYKEFLQQKGSIVTAVLSGLKGSGKSLTTKQICLKALQEGYPVIIIGEPFAGPSFDTWIEGIEQSAVLLIDEFEKVYQDKKDRDKLLTFLDGSVKTHKLVLMTMNDSLSNYTYFYNRPGRVLFNIEYASVSEEVVREYCLDNLKDTSKLEDLVKFSRRFQDFTLDILSVLVSKVNSHPDYSLEVLTTILNVKPENKPSYFSFEYQASLNGSPISVSGYSNFKTDVALSLEGGFVETVANLNDFWISFIGKKEKLDPLYTKLKQNGVLTNYELSIACKDDVVSETECLHLKVDFKNNGFKHTQDPSTQALTITCPSIGLEIKCIPMGVLPRKFSYHF